MGEAAAQVGSAAGGLAAVVDDLNREMGEVLQSVKTDLNGVLANMNQDFTQNLKAMAEQMGGATHKLSEIMESVKHDLGGTIQMMSEGFKDSMVGMASDLRSATDNISTSIDGMSDNVNSAMQEVAKNMEHASTVQKATSVQFSAMSSALSENVTVMSSNMDAIGNSISGGLESVSSSNQRIGKLASNFEKIATSLQELPQDLQLVVKALGTSSNDVSSQLEGIHSTLTQSTRYANAADAVMKVPASINELSTLLLKPKDEILKVQQSLAQLLEVATDINDSIHALKPVEVLQEA
jgi:methyl-accepting chemotaxis protein